MNDELKNRPTTALSRTWQVGALCRAIADSLDARFNPVTVQGEISGFSRASSGHCYFSLKDATGQIRCAMFKRAANLTEFMTRDGDLVEVRGRIDVYTPRGDLQLIVESMSQAGQGALFEQFLRLKAKLEAEGLFDAARKRELPIAPRGIGLVTSLGAAALHDVITALQRRVPHIPVIVSPASVQGVGAPQELCQALANLYQYNEQIRQLEANLMHKAARAPIDVILLVRGGGSLEDLWAFNDETLARTIAQSPVPVISGVGHETDFTIADFVADLRAPTPTAAAELVSQSRDAWLAAVDMMQERLQGAANRHLDTHNQHLDRTTQRLGRPAQGIGRQQQVVESQFQRMRFALKSQMNQFQQNLNTQQTEFPHVFQKLLDESRRHLSQHAQSLSLLDPQLVLQRGYAWVVDANGVTVTDAKKTKTGQGLHVTLARGQIDVTVASQAGDALF